MTKFSIFLRDELATAQIASTLAPFLKAGDCILLEGEIGAGKTAFSRSLIQTRLSRLEDVPSPTFTLVQTYEHPDCDIWHCDLYRLTHPDEALELGLDDAFDAAICLIEWPDRLCGHYPPDALTFHFEPKGSGRQLSATVPDALAYRFASVFSDA